MADALARLDVCGYGIEVNRTGRRGTEHRASKTGHQTRIVRNCLRRTS